MYKKSNNEYLSKSTYDLNSKNSSIKYNKILEAIPECILLIDQKGSLFRINHKKECRLFKSFSPSDDLTIDTVFKHEGAKKFHNGIEKCKKQDKYKFKFQIKQSNRIYHYDCQLINSNSQYFIAIITDTTQKISYKSQLIKAKQKTEEALKGKSAFLASISHDIRTPLNAILGFSQWLYDNTLNSHHREYLNTILISSRSLLNLLNDILDLSKIESGKMDIDLQPMNFLEVINDIKLIFQRKVEEKGISLKITTDSSVPPFFYMDELRFYQILFNLVSNAIKFTNKGLVHISSYATKAKALNYINLHIIIKDTGIGIDKSLHKTIFDTYTRPGDPNKRIKEGTGFGLAIVYGLLKKLNGKIKLFSELGKGSTFKITFNNVKIAKPEISNQEQQKEKNTMELSPCTIMITDDVNYNILVLKQLINSKQVKYIEAKDGTEALAKLKTEKPDIIFMDIRMPGISGFDTTEMIKQDKDLKHIPVIAFTASTLKDHNKKINSLFDGFLQKPVFKKDLESILKQFLKYSYSKNKLKSVK